ncbi:MAG: response regulator transcription factor [Acidimicrobiales bacterium]
MSQTWVREEGAPLATPVRGGRTMDGSARSTTILTIEDDGDIRQLLRTLLGREGYTVCEAETGRQGIRTFHQTRPDVVILDIGLPDIDGWQVLERIRDMSDVPVMVLTARSAERDKVRGLNAGADDYLTKPFSRVELLARLQAVRRRRVTAPVAQTSFDDGRVRMDFLHQQAYLNGDPVLLTPTEYRLLSALVRHAGQILSADQLVELAWDEPAGLAPARVKYAILRLRRKLDWESDDAPLRTVRGFGYRYEPLTD